MLWFIFSLIAAALWAASNIVDEYVIDNDLDDPVALVIITGLFSAIPVIFLILTGKFVMPGLMGGGALLGGAQGLSWEAWGIAIASGIVGLLVYLPYFKALELAPPASVILMWNMAPVFVVAMAFTILGERLRPQDYIAIIFLVSSAFLAAYKSGHGKHISRAFPWMILASILIAAESILEKATYERAVFTAGLGWIYASSFIASLFLLTLRKKTRVALKKSLRWNVIKLFTANEGLDLGASMSASFAIAMGPVSLVEAVGGVQPIFVILFTFLILSLKKIKFRKHMTRADITRAVISVVLAVVGLLLVRQFD